jgi:rhamnosyltransferase subunit B
MRPTPRTFGIKLARILLAWELGGGLGHMVRFERLIKELRSRGHALSLALPYLQHAKNLDLSQDNIRNVPEWPGVARRRRDRTGISWITYGDMLADIIFTDSNEIAAHIAVWRRVIDDSKADIVIADYAPGAVLAARNFIQCVNIGDGYTLPPHDMADFPRLWPGEGPTKHREADVAARRA